MTDGRALRDVGPLTDGNVAQAVQHILAVEIDDNINFGEQLSPPLAAAYDELRDEILAEVRRVLDGDTASEADGEPATARSATWR